MPEYNTSRFLQGDGRPVLMRYNGSGVLQETITMPYVRDDGNNSYIRQYFNPYPENNIRQHNLLTGSVYEDIPVGYKFNCSIKYQSILAQDLELIYNCILTSLYNLGHYLKLKPRNDHDGTFREYEVVFNSIFSLESSNMWRHNVVLDFKGKNILTTALYFEIPPVVP